MRVIYMRVQIEVGWLGCCRVSAEARPLSLPYKAETLKVFKQVKSVSRTVRPSAARSLPIVCVCMYVYAPIRVVPAENDQLLNNAHTTHSRPQRHYAMRNLRHVRVYAKNAYLRNIVTHTRKENEKTAKAKGRHSNRSDYL